MSHALVTITAPIDVVRLPEALALIQALDNPASPAIAEALDRLEGDDGVHFTSLHAVPPEDAKSGRGHLVFEFSADGTEDAAIERIAQRIGHGLSPVFACAQDWRGGSLAGYLKAHKVRIGQGWFGEAGLVFAGTPGMSVGRIRREAKLAGFLAGLVEGQSAGVPALERLEVVRRTVRENPDYAWGLGVPTALPRQPHLPTLTLVWQLVVSFAATYLWPLLIPFLVVLAFGAVHVWAAAMAILTEPVALWLKAWNIVQGLWHALLWALAAITAFAVPMLALAAVLYISLRTKEASDGTSDVAPRRDVLLEMVKRENHYVQNHMISVTLRKPGFTRMVTLKLAFWLILALAARTFRPGFLANIGTIHFARWVTIPGTRQVVFFSNFGGSWESYLEDFITKAHDGLTAVWSNTVGFPRAENLFQKGATDGERFKRFARQSMLPTPFWYCAYPTVSSANIRTNAALRVGLAAAATDEEAKTWLALFGSASRPVAKLESNQIQSLVFGGLSFMPHGQLLLADFAATGAPTRDWLRAILPEVAFDDGRRLGRDAVVTLALGPGAMAKAGLSDTTLDTFPPAYLEGMRQDGRARILGDRADELTWWQSGYDAAILVYGKNDTAVAQLSAKITKLLATHGHGAPHAVKLIPVDAKASKRLEPFGFVDGTSQPVIRGTYRGLRSPDPIHLVEPGEFILGYPDNRGNLPPGPELPATEDPQNRLPIRCDSDAGFGGNAANSPRDVARNGSFLVIRQLEQDAKAFWNYCEAESKRLKSRLGEPYDITPEFIGAKLVGRWPDGSSLVRNPYRQFTDEKLQNPTGRPAANPDGAPAVHAAPANVANGAADNDFLFGTEDPEGVRCPFGAHIRRANPRDSLDPGSQDQIDISNRHRILRVGRGYVPEAGQNPGLMFMCLNGDLERQFEFVQQTWMGSETFHGLAGERDPLAGVREGCPVGYTVPTRDGPVRLSPMARFVTPRGGGYFFLPGRRLLEFLGS